MTAADLISKHVASGLIDERLSDVAFRVSATGSHYCVVLDDDGSTFLGLVRFADVISRVNPSFRILGDLLGAITPIVVRASDPAPEIILLFEKHALGEAVVLNNDNRYVGLITSESVLEWTREELRRTVAALRSQEAAILPETDVKQPSRELILLVEDHAATREALRQILQRRKYDVIDAGSVEEALSLAATNKFTLVISDIGLPDGTGYRLMVALREKYGIRGIAASGFATDGDIARSNAAGFSSHLKKPINIRDLDAAIARAIMDRRRTPSDA